MKSKITIRCPLLTGVISAGAILLMASGASAQNIFVANWFNGEIYDFTPQGNPGIFYPGSGGEPEDLAFNSSGSLFVAASLANEIDVITGGTESSFASVDDPHGLAFDSSGNLYVTGYATGDIYEISPTGTVTTFATGLSNPTGLAFNSSGDLFVNNHGNGNIDEFLNTGGTLSSTFSIFATGLSGANGLAFNSVGDLFSAENSSGTGDILEFTPQGHQSTYASGLGGYGQLAFDASGNLFMSNGTNVLKIDIDGDVTSLGENLGNATGIAIQNLALPVPEPSTLALAGLGAAALCLWRRRK